MRIYATPGSQALRGGIGTDTVVYNGFADDYTINVNDLITVRYRHVDNDSDSLVDIERIEFIDKAFAFDLSGNAGSVAKLINALFGSSYLAESSYTTIGLKLLDDGMSYGQLAALAVEVSGNNSPRDICERLWVNLMHTEPTLEDIAPFINTIKAGLLSIGDLVVFAADSEVNVQNIELVGLARTGLVYSPSDVLGINANFLVY